ncbi:MAG: indole-3-glycerol-phosphate synthase [Verrucomicrobia bacterium]|nr:indole-3-glycerol-phosphate synthase [Verrucomicrobiota bacterium]
MKTGHSILDRMLCEVEAEIAEAKRKRPLADIKRMIQDAPEVRSFGPALREGFGLIAEIKACSPSHGPFPSRNVKQAPKLYDSSRAVRAISVLTNATRFGMSIQRLRDVRSAVNKPVLRKEFILDEYQVYEARAFGADAILLMANVLDGDRLRALHRLARGLGMDALFECHTIEEIRSVPRDAVIYGINSRNFDSKVFRIARAVADKPASRGDPTTDLAKFKLVAHLPKRAIKVAESGVAPGNISEVRDRYGFHAALVGTSLLAAEDGIAAMLQRFEDAILDSDSG